MSASEPSPQSQHDRSRGSDIGGRYLRLPRADPLVGRQDNGRDTELLELSRDGLYVTAITWTKHPHEISHQYHLLRPPRRPPPSKKWASGAGAGGGRVDGATGG